MIMVVPCPPQDELAEVLVMLFDYKNKLVSFSSTGSSTYTKVSR